jgi:hypothetical protein
MNGDYDPRSLAAETLALQSIVGMVLNRLYRQDSRLAGAIRLGLDDAASHVEDMAIRVGKAAPPEHTVKALRIVEELRTIIVGNHH